MIISAALLEQKRRLLWSAIIYTAFFFGWLIYINVTQQQNSGLKMTVGIPFYFICLFFLVFRYYKMRELLYQHSQLYCSTSDLYGQESDFFDEAIIRELSSGSPEAQDEALIREIEQNGPPSYKDLTEAPHADSVGVSPPAYAFDNPVAPPCYNEVFTQPPSSSPQEPSSPV